MTYGLRSLEDTMDTGALADAGASGAWELVKILCRTNAMTAAFRGCCLTLEHVKPTQPESLILAQSERWRQA